MDERLANVLERLDVMADENVDLQSNISRFGYLCLLLGFLCMSMSTLHTSWRAIQSFKGYRKLEQISAIITGVASLFYFIMLSGYGRTDEHYQTKDGYMKTRPVFWARYVDWVVTTPLILVNLLIIAGVPYNDMLFVVGIDVLMILLGYAGTFTDTFVKWICFLSSCVFFGYIIMVLLRNMTYNRYGVAAKKLYAKVAYLTIILWTCYPVVWFLGEGTKIINVDLEICFYMFLDVAVKCIFAYLIISTRKALLAIYSAKNCYNQILSTEDEDSL